MSNLALSFITGIFFASLLAGFINRPCPDIKEYQINIEFDTVTVYDSGRFVGSYIIGDTLTQFEIILADDNR